MVIERQARKALGVAPGWRAVQTVVDDHLEVRFLPPEHDESLAGSLHAYAGAKAADLAQAKQAAWKAHIEEGWDGR